MLAGAAPGTGVSGSVRFVSAWLDSPRMSGRVRSRLYQASRSCVLLRSTTLPQVQLSVLPVEVYRKLVLKPGFEDFKSVSIHDQSGLSRM